jgi:hypothetical protein
VSFKVYAGTCTAVSHGYSFTFLLICIYLVTRKSRIPCFKELYVLCFYCRVSLKIDQLLIYVSVINGYRL